MLATFSMHIEHDLGWTEGHYAKVHEAIVAVLRNFLESDGNIPIERGGDIRYVDHRTAFRDQTSELVHPRADGGRTHTPRLFATGRTQPLGSFAICAQHRGLERGVPVQIFRFEVGAKFNQQLQNVITTPIDSEVDRSQTMLKPRHASLENARVFLNQ